MNAFAITLRLLGAAIAGVALIHLVLGPGADVLLGAQLSDVSRTDAVLDSQNRFYGVAFALYAAVLIVASFDLARYAPILRWAFVIFFIAGAARLWSVVETSWPGGLVVALGVIELGLPPFMLLWLKRLNVD
jgi:hypothetical protein